MQVISPGQKIENITENPLITVSLEADLAKVTINLPEKPHNSCLDLYENLLEKLNLVQKSSEIKFVLLEGIDDPLNQWGILRTRKKTEKIGNFDLDGEAGANVYDVFQRVLDEINSLDKIVVSVVDGNVLEQGLSISMVSDFVISTSRSSWGAPNLGKHMVPSWSCVWRLKELIGKMRAKKICFTETIESAETAVLWGLWTDVVLYNELDKSVNDFINQLRLNNPKYNRQLKYVFNNCNEFDLDSAQSFESFSANLLRLRNESVFATCGVARAATNKDNNYSSNESKLKKGALAKKFWEMEWETKDM